MPSNFNSGKYKIFTRDYHRPVSIDESKSAFQDVRLNLPVQTVWSVESLDVPGLFRLRIRGYASTGVTSDEQIKDKVFVSVRPEDDVVWHATYREEEDAFTIERVDDRNKGWTALPELSPFPHIALRKFNNDLHDQLFRFEPVFD